ncbi:13126_t:CDS:2 [Funneliformis geosporum]|uniref:13126_t:CDS:1 n=1 Tax=Funneliformis geosporum TaxID=1117311 RepID=A0A9W4T0Z4_9GLOM|nr:13126_t:CDS:2 [Funneliformis geosporum]
MLTRDDSNRFNLQYKDKERGRSRSLTSEEINNSCSPTYEERSHSCRPTYEERSYSHSLTFEAEELVLPSKINKISSLKVVSVDNNFLGALMNKQDIIICNQKDIMNNINDIKKKLDNHDKELELLTHNNAETGSFGINQLQPFKEKWRKDEIKNWKNNSKIRIAYNELYNHIDSQDQESDTYIAKFIKKMFARNDRTELNALWIQAVLEIIFDPEYLSTKLDTKAVDKRFEMLKNEKEA